jgi:hypothetical protein
MINKCLVNNHEEAGGRGEEDYMDNKLCNFVGCLRF